MEFIARPIEEIHSDEHMPRPFLTAAPTVPMDIHDLLNKPIPQSPVGLENKVVALRKALHQTEDWLDAAQHIIEGQGMTVALQAVGYEEQVRKAGVREQKARSHTDKCLLKKAGRHLTGPKFCQAAERDRAERNARGKKEKDGKAARQARAALKGEYQAWRKAAAERRDKQRAKDLQDWNCACKECHEGGMHCPKKPRAPQRETTPEMYRTVGRKRPQPQDVEGEASEGEISNDENGDDFADD